MLDHPFGDAVGALRSSFETALLERQAIEERFGADALTGDLRWETAYSIPGEGHPARVQADISAAWPTWSQSAYRTWHLTGELQTVPEIEVEIVFRGQDLPFPPDPASVLGAVADSCPPLGRSGLTRQGGPTIESTFDEHANALDHAVEVPFSGTIEISEQLLADGNELDAVFSAAGPWISSSLIALSDALTRS